MFILHLARRNWLDNFPKTDFYGRIQEKCTHTIHLRKPVLTINVDAKWTSEVIGNFQPCPTDQDQWVNKDEPAHHEYIKFNFETTY